MKSVFNFQLLLITLFLLMSSVWSLESMNDDLLYPYQGCHGSRHSHRQLREIQSGINSTYESWTAHVSSEKLPATTTRYFVADIPLNSYYTYEKNHVYGHYTTIRNPRLTFSVVEPAGEGCNGNSTATVEKTSVLRKCIVAQNGGYFNTTTGSCLGNVVSDGKLARDSHGVQNAHFGITRNGTIICQSFLCDMLRYLSEGDVKALDFLQLVGGVIWLVRNGTSYVDEAVSLEEEDTEETGTLRHFADVQSARTAIGHDEQGSVVFVQVDGQTGVRGVNLAAFAKYLIDEFHLVNAINLDGGGSATLVLNGSLASYPSDHCKGAPKWRCPRSVTTIICAHSPDCEPVCVNGKCIDGSCICENNWHGEACDVLRCAFHNCSAHGSCNQNGCFCYPGWYGDDCSLPCPRRRYGTNCSQICYCENNSSCNPVSGECACLSGFMGKACDQGCPAGRYGRDCSFSCHCSDTCLCDSVTGACDAHINTSIYSTLLNVSQCLARNFWSTTQMDTPDVNSRQYQYRLIALLSTALGALAISLSLNALCMWRFVNREDNDSPASSTDEASISSESSDGATVRQANSLRSGLLRHIVHRIFPRGRYEKLNANGDVIEMEERTLLSAVT
ncbi:N-acetylglucosamine-1-phosphodiester alpha-N-acetylglucosaminidase-like isoform X2 [Clavelina lepadiformis]|uniref:N-acetylglucosamine-1-phosphodiester alpha-N-acetylglucosaminidase-like isoform X2 n=1 Tax=Clavelina lepadiformis TaxID=159417 RepID=UPI0040433805